jgi:hypothetical protein
MNPGIQIEWHTLEKFIWGAVTFTGVALLTIARPWLARQLFRLVREHRAEYREMDRELRATDYQQLDEAVRCAEEALSLMHDLKTRVERLESASEEQGIALGELHAVPNVIDRIEGGIRDCLNAVGTLRQRVHHK